MKSLKHKLAVEQLESEMELINREEQQQIKGGMGVVTSGSGTATDPYIISVNYYSYGLDSGQLNGLQAAADQYNSAGMTMKEGKNYKFNVSITQTQSAMQAEVLANSASWVNDYGERQSWGNIVNASDSPFSSGNIFGTNEGNKITLNRSNIEHLMNNSSGANFHVNDLYTSVFAHEIGHSLGYKNEIGGDHSTGSPGGLMQASVDFLRDAEGKLNVTFGTLSAEDISAILNNGLQNGGTSEMGTGIRM